MHFIWKKIAQKFADIKKDYIFANVTNKQNGYGAKKKIKKVAQKFAG